MPTLPDFTAFGQERGPAPAGSVVGLNSSMGAQIGAAGNDLSVSGQHLERAAAILTTSNLEQDRRVAEAAVNKLQAARLALQADPTDGFGNVHGEGAVGTKFVDDYRKRFDDAASAIEQNLQGPEQKNVFKQRSQVVALQYQASLLAHQAKETDAFNNQTENAQIDLARRQIFQAPQDPGALAAGLAQIDWAIDQKARRLGFGSEVAADTKAKYRQAVFDDAASLMIERDPRSALAMLNKRVGYRGQEPGDSGSEIINGLDTQKLVALRHRAQATVDQMDNKSQAEADARLREAEKTVKDLQSFTMQGLMVDPGYEREVRAAVAGTPFEKAASEFINLSYAGASFGSQTLPAQEARLKQWDAQAAAAGTNPEMAKLVASARQITQTQRAAYAENPWAAATRFGRAPDAGQATIGSPDQAVKVVAQRLALQPVVESYAGGAVSPLQPDEARDFATVVQSLPPNQRAETLGQIGAMLTAPRIQALADQLDKGSKPLALSLKLGAEGTTAGRMVSELVLRGAQALSDKTVKLDDQALAGWRADIAAKVRGTLGDPKAEQDVIDSAFYVRAAQELEGIAAPGFTRGIGSGAEDAIALVAGAPIERAGVKTLLPRGMTADQFNTKTQAAMAPLAGQRLFVRGQPVPAESVALRLGGYGMRYNRGGYTPIVNNAPVTMDSSGSVPLVLRVQ